MAKPSGVKSGGRTTPPRAGRRCRGTAPTTSPGPGPRAPGPGAAAPARQGNADDARLVADGTAAWPRRSNCFVKLTQALRVHSLSAAAVVGDFQKNHSCILSAPWSGGQETARGPPGISRTRRRFVLGAARHASERRWDGANKQMPRIDGVSVFLNL